MVMEYVYPENGVKYVGSTIEHNGATMRVDDSTFEFIYTHVYVYDGAKFFVGNFKGYPGLNMIEEKTLLSVLQQNEVKQITSINSLIESFKNRLSESGRDLHEVIGKSYLKTNLELWYVNFLTTSCGL